MITMLKNWEGAVEVNGKQFDNMTEAISAFKPVSQPICIKLYPKGLKAKFKANKGDLRVLQQSSPIQPEQETVETMYKITVKQYMTKPSEPGFDFMLKWNNDNPMPLRTMVGWIEKETPGMYKMHLKGVAEKTCTCMRCHRTLTNPISKLYGIGPECMQKIGFVGDINDVAGVTEKLEEVEWTGWVIKSAIIRKEEV